MSSHPHAQSKYQVRFDWGLAGAAVVADDADVVIWVDVLETDAASPGETTFKPGALALRCGLADADHVAGAVLDEQVRLGRRARVAVIAAGARRDDELRFCVEDLLGAGAVIDALAAIGLDYCSPEAAAACAAFTGLKGAVAHLATASASGNELAVGGVAAPGIRAAVTRPRLPRGAAPQR